MNAALGEKIKYLRQKAYKQIKNPENDQRVIEFLLREERERN